MIAQYVNGRYIWENKSKIWWEKREKQSGEESNIEKSEINSSLCCFLMAIKIPWHFRHCPFTHTHTKSRMREMMTVRSRLRTGFQMKDHNCYLFIMFTTLLSVLWVETWPDSACSCVRTHCILFLSLSRSLSFLDWRCRYYFWKLAFDQIDESNIICIIAFFWTESVCVYMQSGFWAVVLLYWRTINLMRKSKAITTTTN